MRHLPRWSVCLLAACALAGRAHAASDPQLPSWRMAWRCADGSRLVASFDHAGTPSRAWLGRDDRVFELPAAAGVSDPAEGASYGDARLRLRTRGASAWLEQEGAATLACQGEGVPQRLVIDRPTRLRLALPASWLPARYAVHALRGEDAGLLYSGAELIHVVEYQPQSSELRSQPLLLLAVLPRAAASTGPRPAAQVLASTATHVYLGAVPEGRPYPEGSTDAQTLEVMRAALAQPPQRLQQLFSLLGESEGGPLTRLPVALAARQRPALRPGDELALQLLEPARAGTPAQVVARRRTALPGRALPRLVLSYESDRIDARLNYTVVARLTRQGRLLYAAEARTPGSALRRAAPLRLALAPARGDGAPVEAGLSCGGDWPRWSLRLGDAAGEARLPGRPAQALQGQWRRAGAARPPVSVWRQAAGRSVAPLVAVVTEATCRDAGEDLAAFPGLPFTHSAVVSLPDGQVLQGCCR
ncbi:YbaY family lipoprotein [Aquabacterium sp. A7-Y]|uniref:YbaY family lipoprotein n=1 Tax=Aquabacterium sp. A7-Y TaxID=1349605 RepID=UPI00223E4E81|nr:YbaY family lipoprotein [Aquabacterium sp. A7-Y]MCW7538487.1 YbaY family lipoprotein [Aquabacterium sp. A7-Y]